MASLRPLSSDSFQTSRHSRTVWEHRDLLNGTCLTDLSLGMEFLAILIV
jgi:hypothetical protein